MRILSYKDYIYFGCGLGRDSKYFMDNGYKVKAVGDSIEMCKLASKYISQEIDSMRFDKHKWKGMHNKKIALL